MLTTFFGLQMGMHPLVNPLKMVIYQLKMVIFHSYVSLPEGTVYNEDIIHGDISSGDKMRKRILNEE